MKAMILAAGLGTRLRPLTNDRPKPLVEVAGQPLIAYNLGLLRHYGIRDVIVNLHHHGEALRDALGDGAAYGLRITYSPEDPLLESGGGIKKAEPLLAGENDFLVLNGDTIIDIALDRLIATHRERAAAATLVLRTDPQQDRYGVIEVDGENRIRRFLGRPAGARTDLVPYMFAGVHVLSARVLTFMPELRAFSITRETYPAMIEADELLLGVPFDGFWRVIDTPDDLAAATATLTTGQRLHFSYAGEPCGQCSGVLTGATLY